MFFILAIVILVAIWFLYEWKHWGDETSAREAEVPCAECGLTFAAHHRNGARFRHSYTRRDK